MRGKRKPSVVCTLSSNAKLYHIAKTITGLCRLESQDRIDLTLRHTSAIGEQAIILEWDGMTAGIDLWDHSDRMLPELSHCDLYFKRCVRAEDLKLGGRIRPFGLNYSCRSTRATLRLLSLYGPIDVIRRRNTWKNFFCIPMFTEYERKPDQAASPTILFQARLWVPEDCPGDEQVNEERLELLLALRREFKERLAGGLAPTPYAQQHYPELLTEHPTWPSRYVRWAREHLISIGFRGLFGSLGFKIGEAYAASQCLVFEPSKAYMPTDAPLARYRNSEECIAICNGFLSHPAEAMQLRNQAWEYYRAEVEPGAHMAKLLGLVQ
jgi:hypothetical protein